MALKRGIVELENYNEKWKEEYLKEEELLKEVLKEKIIEIHHVGSTSIEGLMAKPVIDIMIAIKSFDEIEEIEQILKNYDYENRGHQGVESRYFFAKGPAESRTHYVHFVLPNNSTYYDLIYFKKYLIEHPEEKEKYCTLKKELAEKYADERPKYTKGKNNFITEIIRKAEREYND